MTIETFIDELTLADHVECVSDVAATLNLQRYLKYFQENNPNVESAYHSNLHSFATMLNCYEGVMNSTESHDKSSVVAITLAGLFHDFQHLQGMHNTDKDNINVAVAGLRRCHESLEEKHRIDDSVLELTVDLIKSTQYPYLRKAPKTALEGIIRDADLMGMYLASSYQRLTLLSGLFNEIQTKRQFSKQHALTFSEYLELQRDFLTNINWCSRWGRMKAVKRNAPRRVLEYVTVPVNN